MFEKYFELFPFMEACMDDDDIVKGRFKDVEFILQIMDDHIMVLWVYGFGLSVQHVQWLISQYGKELRAKPMSKAHTRLYKRLGFTGEDVLVYKGENYGRRI